MAGTRRKSGLLNAVWSVAALCGLVAIYLLSYPFVVRLTGDADITGYRPVQWLIDGTPAREPMFLLADACGCGAEVRDAAFNRELAVRDQFWQLDLPL